MEERAATDIQAHTRGWRTRTAVVRGVRAEYERTFEEIEGRSADHVAWLGGGKLSAPRERRPLADVRPRTLAGHPSNVRGGADEVQLADAETERLEVERELAWIRQAMHSRLEYLEETQNRP
ncbi:hypothetical protein KFE25_006397 [Diacronema lutheri]|uniref:Uncharacterized protein n=1 Tax=Diacronema lutheri TaxID=2081491 RepID=A0A8J6CCI9_DIALT|nr:hypothetical protein KFE25_006397 [Diacronema lutheri]